MTSQRAYLLGGPLHGKHCELTAEKERIIEINGEKHLYLRFAKFYGYRWQGQIKEEKQEDGQPSEALNTASV